LTPTSSLQQDSLDSAFEQQPRRTPAAQPPATLEFEEEDPFEMPDRVSGANYAPGAAIQNVNFEAADGEALNPYGRDMKHANPEWLRGVLEFNPKERAWQITYAERPDPRDPNGGTMTLGHHASLTRCRTGDIVVVDGAIDASRTDSRGKPLYVLDSVIPLASK
jgi:hypothetical protein